MRFILELLITAAAFYLGAHLLAPHVTISGFGEAILVAVVVGLLNATLGLILRAVTFPVNFLTLGLMSFVISVLIIYTASGLMSGFHVQSFLWAAVLAIIVAVIKAIFGMLTPARR